jgi:glycosyltransferase involved in cell wall biosynthesis
MGGTSTLVNVLARTLNTHGHFCALGYLVDSEHPSLYFENKIKLVKENRLEAEMFFKKFIFDIIYNTQAIDTDFEYLKSLIPAECKIISAYHNRPQLRYFHLESLLELFHESNNFFYKLYTLCKIPLLPFWRYKSQHKQRIAFQKMVDNSDKVQILSENFISIFLKIVPNTNKNKIVAIGNPVVFDSVFPIGDLKLKRKKVLVVCSVNFQKRAYIMIKIWAEIEKDHTLEEWTFDFVGGGLGYERLKKMAINLNLKRINFLNFQNPEKYFNESNIFMMTSRFEGMPMVLLESMQMGVVPVVYDSFESLTDIIVNGENGYIIPNNDFGLFVKQIKYLMQNEVIRNNMAVNAIIYSERFSIDKIIKKYLALFNSI